MHLNHAYAHQQEFEQRMCQLGANWAVSWNASGTPTAYLEYHGRFYVLGSPEVIATMSMKALCDTLALIKRHPEQGSTTLPCAGRMEVRTPGYQEHLAEKPPVWLQELQAPTPQRARRKTIPLARLYLPKAMVQQILQLPADYTINQVVVEEDGIAIYCVTPESTAMDTALLLTNPVLHADYRLEERDGVLWRSLVSVRVESQPAL